MINKNILKTVLTTGLFCLVLASCAGNQTKTANDNKQIEIDFESNQQELLERQRRIEEEKQKRIEEEQKKIAEEDKNTSSLTGLKIDENKINRRPVAVMINNLRPATPQSGLSSAAIIYEAPVEGYITRFMAIFDDYDNVEKIGSIRSARTYYVRYCEEFDAICIHVGEAYNVRKLLNSDNNITMIRNNDPIYRTNDIKAPHNCFTSGPNMLEYLKKTNMRNEKKEDIKNKKMFLFNDNDSNIDTADNTGAANKIDLTEVYHINKPYFEYDENGRTYKRYQYGSLMKDKNNNEELRFKNVIIAFTDGRVFDKLGRWDIREKGEGEGYYFTDGRYRNIKWKYIEGRTRYYDSLTHEEIKINKGRTFVCIAINDKIKKLKIS